ncbi:hypothetical protein [Arthrobacter sp. SX1312]|uniref:hypothetical protein n=1 Tax=Arthrobacter sp. SX1312 TaxID=2058896 RepID=UPI000CE3BFFB|nr:hypothetical protein [Arthrobacter sp. SX1312]
MPTFLRALPGLAALMLSFLSGYLWVFAGPYSPALFTIAHSGSAVLCAAVPFTFVLIGRAARRRPDLQRLGAILLAIAGIPVLVANGIYLFSFRSVEASYGDIGGAGLMVLGWAALLITSLACTIGLPMARHVVPGTIEGKRSSPRN